MRAGRRSRVPVQLQCCLPGIQWLELLGRLDCLQTTQAARDPNGSPRLDYLGLGQLPDAQGDFLPVHADIGRGADADADLVASDVDDGHADVVADDNGFAEFARQNQHGFPLPEKMTLCHRKTKKPTRRNTLRYSTASA